MTYVASIFAFEPSCAFVPGYEQSGGCGKGEWKSEYGRYVLVNLSWIIGSAGTLVLDFAVLAQFWVYSGRKPKEVGGGIS